MRIRSPLISLEEVLSLFLFYLFFFFVSLPKNKALPKQKRSIFFRSLKISFFLCFPAKGGKPKLSSL